MNEISTFLEAGPMENFTFSIRILYYIGETNKAVTNGTSSYYMALDKPIYNWELDQMLQSNGDNSSHMLIILDTCYSGGYISKLEKPGRVILTACDPTETANSYISSKDSEPEYEGWFTGHENASFNDGTRFGPLGIVGGILNARDINKDGWKSAGEIFQFASQTTTWYAANETNPKTQAPYSQHPWASYGVAGGDIALVQCEISKPFPGKTKACTPRSILSTSSRYDWSEFEHRLYRQSPSRKGFASTKGPEKPNLLWISYLNDSVTTSPAVAEGMVFVGTLGGNFYALGLTIGEVVWKFETGSAISSSPAFQDGVVFFGTEEPGEIYALDAYTGVVRWLYEIPAEAAAYSSPVVVDDMVFIGCSDGHFLCLSQLEGKLLWAANIGGGKLSSPAILDNVVFVTSNRGVHAVDKLTGALIWEYATTWPVTSCPAVADGLVFVGSENDDKVYALEQDTGELVWSFWTGGWLTSPAVDSFKKLVIVGCRDTRLYCLEERTGFLKWHYINAPNHLSAPTISANGLVYVGSTDGNLYCINEDTGEEIWKYDVDVPIVSSPSVIYEHVLVGSLEGKIYCFGPPFPIHNIAVSNVTVSSLELRTGEVLEVNCVIENYGSVEENISITCGINSSNVWTAPEHLEPTMVHSQNVTIAAGDKLVYEYSWNTSNEIPGLYSISIQADLVPDEIDASDNVCIINNVLVMAVAVYDVAIVDVTPSKKVVGQGYSLSMNMTVENQGDSMETFNITAYANATIIETKEITLINGNSSILTFTWNTAGFAKGNYTISAEATTILGEVDLTDNVFTNGFVLVTIPGDVNGDGKVRVDDILLIALAFGSNCGDLNYDPNLDVTDDCKIRVDDILVAALHFGEPP